MRIIIRKALPEDAFDFTDCHISCFLSAYKGIVPDDYLNNLLMEKEQLVEKYIKRLTDQGNCEYYCVINDGKMIGFLIINKSHDEINFCIGEIWAIYLIKEFWDKGYGKEMLNFAINELKRVDNKEIFLWVLEENIRARKFYEKNKFSFDGTKGEQVYGKSLVKLRYVYNE